MSLMDNISKLLVSVMVGSPLWDMDKSLSHTHENKIHAQGQMSNQWLEPKINTDIVCYLLKPIKRGCSKNNL